jgi:Uma2 family endonuclease
MPNLNREWTVDDLENLPDDGNRYEVIDGELFVTPAPSLTHQRAVLRLAQILGAYLDTERVGYLVIAPADVVFSNKRGVQPDLFATPPVNGHSPKRFEDAGRLLLVVEVLSPSTARSDRVVKRMLFRDEGVPEFWIVELDSRTFERSTPTEARPEILVDQLTWHPEGTSNPLVIDLPAYFAAVLDD